MLDILSIKKLACFTSFVYFCRFVRFVSTPEILERVYTIESEVLQIEEAIAIQGNTSMGISPVCKNLMLFFYYITALKGVFQVSSISSGGRKSNKTCGKC